MRLKNKVAIVTGAGTGIGKAIAHAFAAEGARLVIGSRNRINLERTAAELRRDYYATVTVVITDVTNSNQVRRLFKKTMDEHGQLDILVNNAATGGYTPIDQMSLGQWNDIVGVNLTGVFLCTREAMKIMKEKRSGRIINIGSISAERPRENSAPYSTSKHAVWGLTKSTALDGRPYGISCGQLNPGNTLVEWRAALEDVEGMNISEEPMIQVEDMARAALYMATLPPEASVLEMKVIPVAQPFIGRG